MAAPASQRSHVKSHEGRIDLALGAVGGGTDALLRGHVLQSDVLLLGGLGLGLEGLLILLRHGTPLDAGLARHLLDTLDVRVLLLVLLPEVVQKHEVGRRRSGRALQKLELRLTTLRLVLFLGLGVGFARDGGHLLEGGLLVRGHLLPALAAGAGDVHDALGVRVVLLVVLPEAVEEEVEGGPGPLGRVGVALLLLLARLGQHLLLLGGFPLPLFLLLFPRGFRLPQLLLLRCFGGLLLGSLLLGEVRFVFLGLLLGFLLLRLLGLLLGFGLARGGLASGLLAFLHAALLHAE
mmetsp:Transcript_14170/g.32477  ORF Transcript_14170/g.32477 Transcript_14170/m.32477 type:complete len:293 (-) Transcript_14170:413-1291(-)